MSPIRPLLGCVFVLAVSSCGDGNVGTGGAGAGVANGGNGNGTQGGNGTGNGTQGGGGSGQGGDGTGAGSTGGAPPCTANTLADAVRVTTATISGASGARALTAQAGSGSVVAWSASDGNIHITKLDAVDAPTGELTVAGMQVYGIAASDSDIALLVSRPPDYMTFIHIDMSGAEIATTNLVGGGDHNEIGVEWFGDFAQTGRLVRQNDGTFAAYHALHRRWPDNIGHQGDTLRLLDGSGTQLGGGWDWGCSHSMDQRLATAPWGTVPICIADCYPGKGIYYDHDVIEITTDPAANCAGGFSTLLGGLVGTAGGFFIVYQDAQGAAHLGQFNITNGQPAVDRVLGVAGSSRLALYDGGMLLGSDAAGTSIQRLDATGADVGGPAPVSAPLPDGDFESRADGEVAWASASGTTLTVVRVRICQ